MSQTDDVDAYIYIYVCVSVFGKSQVCWNALCMRQNRLQIWAICVGWRALIQSIAQCYIAQFTDVPKLLVIFGEHVGSSRRADVDMHGINIWGSPGTAVAPATG